MKSYYYIVSSILLLLVLLISSCKSNDNSSENTESKDGVKTHQYDYMGDKLVITDKIMYDVCISNDIIGDRSKQNPDWFWDNLPTPDADEFLKTLLADAVSGKLKTYYYDMTGDYESFDLIAEADLKKYMDEVFTYEYEIVDTTVNRYKTQAVEVKLGYQNVKKLRFLEEWFFADGKFYKKIIAVAPYFVIEYPGLETINAVYFWILVDAENQNN